MTEDWGRFIWWLYHDPNAPGVVQAFASVVTVLLTAALIFFTWRYTRLTNESVKIAAQMATTAARQLAASSQPELRIEFDGRTFISGSHNVMIGSWVTVENAGDSPVKIRRMAATVIGTTAPVSFGEIPVPRGLVLTSGKTFRNKLILDSGTTTLDQNVAAPAVLVDCSDLAEVSEHRFLYDESEGLRHSLGFN